MHEFLGLSVDGWTLISLLIGVFTTVIGISIRTFNKTTIYPLKQSIDTAVTTLSSEIDKLREDLNYSRQNSKQNEEKLFSKIDSHESRISYQEALSKTNSTRISKLEEKIK